MGTSILRKIIYLLVCLGNCLELTGAQLTIHELYKLVVKQGNDITILQNQLTVLNQRLATSETETRVLRQEVGAQESQTFVQGQEVNRTSTILLHRLLSDELEIKTLRQEVGANENQNYITQQQLDHENKTLIGQIQELKHGLQNATGSHATQLGKHFDISANNVLYS